MKQALKNERLKKYFIFISILLFTFTACEKQEGKGGAATIKGTVMMQEYNKDFTIAVGDPYPAQDVDVYLIYGDDEIYGDKFQTGWDGKYEFKYLQIGKYKVYVMSKSKDNSLTNKLVPVFKEIEITRKEQVFEVDTINIID